MLDLIRELVVELIRALLIDGLVERVRRRFENAKAQRRSRRHHQIVLRVHIRNRDRLLHKLFTELRRSM
jgi:hypothetical protein